MNISNEGIENLIKKGEGLEFTAYQDVGGLWTIGYGHLIKSDEDYLMNKTLTQKEVDDLLRNDLSVAVEAVNDSVTVPVSQNMFDSLVSFTFNLGGETFRESTLVDKVNAGADNDEIAFEFRRWVYATIDGVKQVVKGLKKRREDEISWFSGTMGKLRVIAKNNLGWVALFTVTSVFIGYRLLK